MLRQAEQQPLRGFRPVKKIVLLAAAALVGAAVVAAFFVRRAPELLVRTLEGGLGKRVVLEGVRYRFPLGFGVRKLVILEKGRFEGETSFYVENVFMAVRPAPLFGGRVVISELSIQGP